MKIKSLLCEIFLIMLVFSGCTKEDSVITSPDQSAQLKSASLARKYIVLLKTDALLENQAVTVKNEQVKKTAGELLTKYGIKPVVGQVFGSLQGFTVTLSEQEAALLAKDIQIKAMGEDRQVSLPPNETFELKSTPPFTASGTNIVPWGIARVGGPFTYTGSNVIWILDTGVALDHPDLNVDKVRARSFIPGEPTAMDLHYHGTHVAGIAAAIDNNIYVTGVAAGATVVPVKVLDRTGHGSWEGIMNGLNYVAENGVEGDVANMSLGGAHQAIIDSAVVAASQKVKFVLAAGNETDDACNHSPASAEGKNILTISAMDNLDYFANFSNFGRHVDYCAPGVNIMSLYVQQGYVLTISGTSMAAPHVAGLWLLGKIKSDGFVLNDPDGKGDKIAYMDKNVSK